MKVCVDVQYQQLDCTVSFDRSMNGYDIDRVHYGTERHGNHRYLVSLSTLSFAITATIRSYGDIAMKALASMFLSTRSSARKDNRNLHRICGSLVIGLRSLTSNCIHYANEMLPYKPTIFFDNIIDTRFALLIAGPINRMSDECLLQIGTFLLSLSEINALMRISKRFARLFASDAVWQSLHLDQSIWNMGNGSDGTESNYWNLIKEQQGLSICNMHRLCWYSHRYSRLKLLYGKLEVTSLPVKALVLDQMPALMGTEAIDTRSSSWMHRLVSCLGDQHQDALTRPIPTVIVLSLASHTLAKSFLFKLHFVIPTSATMFHLHQQHCTPLLVDGQRLCIEPSPLNSRTRLVSERQSPWQDPGTVLECSADRLMCYRRLGDSRLSFLQFDSPPLNPFSMKALQRSKQVQSRSLSPVSVRESLICNWTQLISNIQAFIILVEFDTDHYDQMLRELRDTLRSHCLVHTASQYALQVPILILIGVSDGVSQEPLNMQALVNDVCDAVLDVVPMPSRVEHRFKSMSNESRDELCAIDELQDIDLGNDSQVQQSQRAWYVQPMSMANTQGDMHCGFMNGLNWLVRHLDAKQS